MISELVRALKALPPEPSRRIRVALAYREKTQTALAREAGIDPGLLSNAMNGNRDLTPEQQEAIAACLQVPLCVLFVEAA